MTRSLCAAVSFRKSFRASFKAIEYLLIKSLLDWAYLTSEQFAPIDVQLLKNCFDKTLPASSTRAFPGRGNLAGVARQKVFWLVQNML